MGEPEPVRAGEAGGRDGGQCGPGQFSVRSTDPDPILGALSALMAGLQDRCEQLARQMELSPPVLMALTQLTGPMPMKDLSHKLGCERSFITAIADELEQRGLIRREPDDRDRRVRNLVLTREGTALRARLDREFLARLPWREALDDTERDRFLGLLAKLVSAPPGD